MTASNHHFTFRGPDDAVSISVEHISGGRFSAPRPQPVAGGEAFFKRSMTGDDSDAIEHRLARLLLTTPGEFSLVTERAGAGPTGEGGRVTDHWACPSLLEPWAKTRV